MNDNILIAKFMGWKVLQLEGGYFKAFKPNAKNPSSIKAICGWKDEKNCWLTISQKAQYHKSWDLIIPVVQKINTLGSKYPLRVADVMLSYSRIDIKELHERVVYFINWYNKQNKNK